MERKERDQVAVKIEKHLFLMPDYLPKFCCKMGDCREACCVGWPISFSLDDYFRLSTLDCSKELRERLDRGVRICLEPRPDRYAEMVPRYDGDCALRLPDGRCAVQAEMGAEALTDVCRLYPRGIRSSEGQYEISCANSCEAVLELMFRRKEPLSFIRQEMEINMPPEAGRKVIFETLGQGGALRAWFIRAMQDRSLSFPDRFEALADALCRADHALEGKDEKALKAMSGEPVKRMKSRRAADAKDMTDGIESAKKLLHLVNRRSDSVRGYGEEALRCFGEGQETPERYLAAKTGFERRVPDWQIRFEHMLVNHMFFSEFPFQDRPENLWEEYMALCVVYTLLRLLSVGWLAQHPEENGFVDVAAAAFRLIEHTDFERYAVYLLREMDMNRPEKLRQWLML